jgi:putative SOS response-associated peptidase YedK
MCGRFTLATPADDLQQAFPGFAFPDEMPLRYNIAPSLEVALVPNNGENRVQHFRWGLVPPWAKDPKIGNRMINARSETLAEKPSFRTAFRKRRCLILADGFYEWRKHPGVSAKTPVYIRLQSGKSFAFAGLWESWKQPDDPPLLSCTIITTEPNALVEKIHSRMPVILPPGAYDQWLDPAEQQPDRLADLLKPYPDSEMTAYPVSTLVNNPRADTLACIKPVETQAQPDQPSLF